ncbi:hypothetical protein Goklo_007564 [Gossypium klotzschianum]|uniref:Uncharacterized protein n=1 Tax=Gossypium klotzschianum TaxID=34286 RepID=A0A7J8UXL5_9ROSI|nr:hypothetical protein [Gossypium klotzschianum]
MRCMILTWIPNMGWFRFGASSNPLFSFRQ